MKLLNANVARMVCMLFLYRVLKPINWITSLIAVTEENVFLNFIKIQSLINKHFYQIA